jgi:hypothetical protein
MVWLSWTVATVSVSATSGLYDAAPVIQYSNSTGGTGLRLAVILSARPNASFTTTNGLLLTGMASAAQAVEIVQLWGVIPSGGGSTRLTADGNAAGATNSIPIKNGHSIAGQLLVTMKNASNSQTAYWRLDMVVTNASGTVTVVSPGAGTIAPTVSVAAMSTATLTVSADNTYGCPDIMATSPNTVSIANVSAVFTALPL